MRALRASRTSSRDSSRSSHSVAARKQFSSNFKTVFSLLPHTTRMEKRDEIILAEALVYFVLIASLALIAALVARAL
jgi:hypothetical protein